MNVAEMLLVSVSKQACEDSSVNMVNSGHIRPNLIKVSRFAASPSLRERIDDVLTCLVSRS